MKLSTPLKIDTLPIFLLAIFLGVTFVFPLGNKFDTTPQMVLLLAFCALTLVISFFAFFNKEKISGYSLEKQRFFQVIDACMKLSLLCYLLWVVFSFFHSQTVTFGFTEVLMTLSGGLLFFSLRSRFLKTRCLYVFFSFLLVITSLFGYFFYFTSHHNRAFGLFFNPVFKTDAWPNAFALFVLFLWPFLFAFWWKAKKWIWLKTVALALVVACLVLSFSRAGLLVFIFQAALLSGVGLYFSLIKKMPIFPWRKRGQIFICLILALALIFAAQYGRQMIFDKTTLSFADKAEFKNNEETTSIGERIDFMKGGLKLALRQPLFGYGPMSFSYIYRSIQTDWLAIADHPHNIFIKIAVENGFPAMIFFLFFLLFLFMKIILYYKHLSLVQRFWLLVIITAFIGGLAHNLVDYNLNFVTNAVIFWLLLALLNQFYLFENAAEPLKNNRWSNWLEVAEKILLLLTVLFFFSCQVFLTGISFLAKRGFLNFEKTQAYLAGHMLYPRYFLLDQAALAIQNKDINLAEKYYLLHLKKNMWDAMAYSQTGNFYLTQGRINEALNYFHKALDLDPKNVWAYYLQYLQVLQKKNDSRTLLALSEKLVNEFKQYTPKVEANIHFTAQNSNSQDALSVLQLLIKYDTAHRSLFTSYFDRISAARNRYYTPQVSP